MKTKDFGLIILLISVVLSLLSSSYLPDVMVSHWGIYGEPDGYSSKAFNLIAFPALIVSMYFLFKYLPKADPKYNSIKKFESDFNIFANYFLLFFLILQAIAFLWNIGIQIRITTAMPLLLGGMFYLIGGLLKKSKSNYTIGIRTPWTLHSDKVWEKTHTLGASLFRLSLPIFILSTFFPKISFLVVLGYVLSITLVLVIYSYYLYKKEDKS